MADHHPPGRPGKATVSHQADRIAQTLADQRRGRRQHFLHAGAALRPFVADHYHVAGLDLLGHDGGHDFRLGIEHPRRPGNRRIFQSRDFGYATLGCQVALEDRQMPLLVQRVVEGTDHILILARLRRNVLQLLGDGASRDCHAVAMQQAVGEKHLQHLRRAASLVEIGDDILSGGLEIAQHRHLAAHPLEVVDGPLDFGRRGNGKIVQHCVGRTAGGHHQANHILDRFAGDDVAWADVLPDGIDQRLCRFPRRIDFFGVGRCHGR